MTLMLKAHSLRAVSDRGIESNCYKHFIKIILINSDACQTCHHSFHKFKQSTIVQSYERLTVYIH